MRAGPATKAGWAVEIAGQALPGGSIYLTVAVPFDTSTWEDGTDLEDQVGLADFMLDIPKWGAIGALISEEESLRVDLTVQPPPRKAAEVAQGEILQTGLFFERRRNRRIREAANRLRELYPPNGWV
jgi:hypothetical protein